MGTSSQIYLIKLNDVAQDQVALVGGHQFGGSHSAMRGLRLAGLELLQILESEDVDEHGIRLLGERCEQHLQEDGILLKITRLGGDILQVLRRELVLPQVARVALLHIHLQHIIGGRHSDDVIDLHNGGITLYFIHHEIAARCTSRSLPPF